MSKITQTFTLTAPGPVGTQFARVATMARSNRPHPASVKKYVRHFTAQLETRESVTADDGYTAEAFAAYELQKLGYPTERFLSMGHSAYGGPAVGNYTYNKPMIRIFRRPVTDGTVNAVALVHTV